jgi:carbamoyl-phosphate synthase large subunit
MRRELLEGTTWRAQVGLFSTVRDEAIRIAEALHPMGPCNFQMRVHRGVPVCFEINIRFSGTTPLRARFGFNEVEATIRHFVLGQPIADMPVVTQGVALRYWNEAYVDPQAVTELERRSQLDEPRRSLTKLEDYGMGR